MTPKVVLSDPEPNGLARMMAGLLEANLARRPERAALLRAAVVEVDAADAGVAVTVRLDGGRVRVSNGSATPRPDVRVRASGHDLLALSAAPLRFGFPDPFRREGRAVLGRIASGQVRVSGMLRHPVVLSRFSRLLSAM
ncbi:MAG: SCP2 sterol-binding domain-containing protein [Actinomycetota bacterium]